MSGPGNPAMTMTSAEMHEMHSGGYFSAATTEWLSFFLMSAGWFILITSFLGYWRVKRWERGIRQASEPAAMPSERDRNVRTGLFSVFGLPIGFEHHEAAEDMDDNGLPITPVPLSALSPELRAAREREVQLERDLRASGLL